MAKKVAAVQDLQAVDGERLTRLSTYKKSLKKTERRERPLGFINFPPVLQSILSLKGFPVSNVTTISGFSDTGKTTLLLHGIIDAQRRGTLPVIILTENKFSFIRAQIMGMDCKNSSVIDEETGELIDTWDGFFVMKNDFINLEEMYDFMLDVILKTRPDKKGNIEIPYDICFFVDSLNKLKSKKSIEKIEDGDPDLPMHNAKAHSVGLGHRIEPRITETKYLEFPYTASMVAILRGYLGSDTTVLKDNGGNTMIYDVGIKLLCGGKMAASTQELTMDIFGRTRAIGKKTRIRVTKNHITGITSEGDIYNCVFGLTDKEGFDNYKTTYRKELQDFYRQFDSITTIENEDTHEKA